MHVELNKRWLSEDNRLPRWNHLRDRCGLEPLTLEQAAELMAVNKQVDKDIREYLEG
jgi:hypothetical protein